MMYTRASPEREGEPTQQGECQESQKKVSTMQFSGFLEGKRVWCTALRGHRAHKFLLLSHAFKYNPKEVTLKSERMCNPNETTFN